MRNRKNSIVKKISTPIFSTSQSIMLATNKNGDRNNHMRPILYFDSINPHSRAVLMLLNILKIEVELRAIEMTKGEHLKCDYAKINPAGTVPALVHKDFVITDNAIFSYVCENNDSELAKQLLALECKERHCRVMSRLFYESQVLHRIHGQLMTDLLRNPINEIDVRYHRKKVEYVYNVIERYLRDSPFIAGAALTAADLSFVACIGALDMVFPIAEKPESWEKLIDWFGRMHSFEFHKINAKGIEKQRLVVEHFSKFSFKSNTKSLQHNHSKATKQPAPLLEPTHTDPAKEAVSAVAVTEDLKTQHKQNTKLDNFSVELNPTIVRTELMIETKGGVSCDPPDYPAPPTEEEMNLLINSEDTFREDKDIELLEVVVQDIRGNLAEAEVTCARKEKPPFTSKWKTHTASDFKMPVDTKITKLTSDKEAVVIEKINSLTEDESLTNNRLFGGVSMLISPEKQSETESLIKEHSEVQGMSSTQAIQVKSNPSVSAIKVTERDSIENLAELIDGENAATVTATAEEIHAPHEKSLDLSNLPINCPQTSLHYCPGKHALVALVTVPPPTPEHPSQDEFNVEELPPPPYEVLLQQQRCSDPQGKTINALKVVSEKAITGSGVKNMDGKSSNAKSTTSSKASDNAERRMGKNISDWKPGTKCADGTIKPSKNAENILLVSKDSELPEKSSRKVQRILQKPNPPQTRENDKGAHAVAKHSTPEPIKEPVPFITNFKGKPSGFLLISSDTMSHEKDCRTPSGEIWQLKEKNTPKVVGTHVIQASDTLQKLPHTKSKNKINLTNIKANNLKILKSMKPITNFSPDITIKPITAVEIKPKHNESKATSIKNTTNVTTPKPANVIKNTGSKVKSIKNVQQSPMTCGNVKSTSIDKTGLKSNPAEPQVNHEPKVNYEKSLNRRDTLSYRNQQSNRKEVPRAPRRLIKNSKRGKSPKANTEEGLNIAQTSSLAKSSTPALDSVPAEENVQPVTVSPACSANDTMKTDTDSQKEKVLNAILEHPLRQSTPSLNRTVKHKLLRAILSGHKEIVSSVVEEVLSTVNLGGKTLQTLNDDAQNQSGKNMSLKSPTYSPPAIALRFESKSKQNPRRPSPSQPPLSPPPKLPPQDFLPKADIIAKFLKSLSTANSEVCSPCGVINLNKNSILKRGNIEEEEFTQAKENENRGGFAVKTNKATGSLADILTATVRQTQQNNAGEKKRTGLEIMKEIQQSSETAFLPPAIDEIEPAKELAPTVSTDSVNCLAHALPPSKQLHCKSIDMALINACIKSLEPTALPSQPNAIVTGYTPIELKHIKEQTLAYANHGLEDIIAPSLEALYKTNGACSHGDSANMVLSTLYYAPLSKSESESEEEPLLPIAPKFKNYFITYKCVHTYILFIFLIYLLLCVIIVQ